MPTKTDFAKIHIGAAAVGITGDDYRNLLFDRYGKASAKDLTPAQVADLLGHLKRQGWKPKAAGTGQGQGRNKYENLTHRRGDWASPRQLRMVEAMWREAADNPTDQALAAFLLRLVKVERLIWLRADKVDAVVAALKAMKGRKNV